MYIQKHMNILSLSCQYITYWNTFVMNKEDPIVFQYMNLIYMAFINIHIIWF